MTTFLIGLDGQPSGKNYFIYSGIFANQSCPSDPDRAGVGIVFAQLVSVVLTGLALIGAVLCDAFVQDPENGEMIPLPTRLKRLKFKKDSCGDRYAKHLRGLLGRFIIVSADTQFCSGLALVISSLVIVGESTDKEEAFSSPFMTLIVYYLCMISSIHQAALLIMRSEIVKHKIVSTIRVIALLCFAVMLVILVDKSYFAFEPLFIPLERIVVGWWKRPLEDERRLEDALPVLIMIWIYSSALFQLRWPSTNEERPTNWFFRPSPSRFKLRRIGKRLLRWILFSNVPTVFVVQMLSAICATTFMLLQKQTRAPLATEDDKEKFGIVAWCDLVDGNENPLSFAQLVSIILAFLPFYSVATAISDR